MATIHRFYTKHVEEACTRKMSVDKDIRRIAMSLKKREGVVWDFGRSYDLTEEVDIHRLLIDTQEYMEGLKVPKKVDSCKIFAQSKFKGKGYRKLVWRILAKTGSATAKIMIKAIDDSLSQKDLDQYFEDGAQNGVLEVLLAVQLIVILIGTLFATYGGYKSYHKINHLLNSSEEKVKEVKGQVDELIGAGSNTLDAINTTLNSLKNSCSQAYKWAMEKWESFKSVFTIKNPILLFFVEKICYVALAIMAYYMVATIFGDAVKECMHYLFSLFGLRLVSEDAGQSLFNDCFEELMELIRTNCTKVSKSNFWKWAGKLPKFVSMAKAIEYVFSNLKKIVNWIIEAITGRPRAIEQNEIDIVTFTADVQEFHNAVTSNSATEFMDEQWEASRDLLKVEKVRITNAIQREKTALRSHFSHMFTRAGIMYEAAAIALKRRKQAAKERVVPVWTNICGDPGLGKSTMLKPLQIDIWNYLMVNHPGIVPNHPWSYGDSYMYVQTNSAFHDGYCEQFYTIVDDLMQGLGTEMRRPVAMDFITFISPEPCALNVATPESKGHMYFSSTCILTTTNVTETFHDLGIQDKRAFTDRITLNIRLINSFDVDDPSTAQFQLADGYEWIGKGKIIGYDEVVQITANAIVSRWNRKNKEYVPRTIPKVKVDFQGPRIKLGDSAQGKKGKARKRQEEEDREREYILGQQEIERTMEENLEQMSLENQGNEINDQLCNVEFRGYVNDDHQRECDELRCLTNTQKAIYLRKLIGKKARYMTGAMMLQARIDEYEDQQVTQEEMDEMMASFAEEIAEEKEKVREDKGKEKANSSGRTEADRTAEMLRKEQERADAIKRRHKNKKWTDKTTAWMNYPENFHHTERVDAQGKYYPWFNGVDEVRFRTKDEFYACLLKHQGKDNQIKRQLMPIRPSKHWTLVADEDLIMHLPEFYSDYCWKEQPIWFLSPLQDSFMEWIATDSVKDPVDQYWDMLIEGQGRNDKEKAYYQKIMAKYDHQFDRQMRLGVIMAVNLRPSHFNGLIIELMYLSALGWAAYKIVRMFMPASAAEPQGKNYEGMNVVHNGKRRPVQRAPKKHTLKTPTAGQGTTDFVYQKINMNYEVVGLIEVPIGTSKELIGDFRPKYESYCLFIGNNIALVPMHTIERKCPEGYEQWVTLRRFGNYMERKENLEFLEELAGDVGIYAFPGMTPKKEIIGLFASKFPEFDNVDQIHPLGGMPMSHSRQVGSFEAKPWTVPVDKDYGSFETDVIFHDTPNYAGLCGIAYCAQTDKKIFAIHMGGNPGEHRAYGVMVFIDDLIKYTAKSVLAKQHDALVLEMDATDYQDGTQPLGRVTGQCAAWCPDTTQIRRSPFDMEKFPVPDPKWMPAMLKKTGNISPSAVGYRQIGDQKYWGSPRWKPVTFDDFLPRRFRRSKLRKLTIMEAIYGIEGYIDALDMTTSPGYYYKKLGLTRKQLFYDEHGNKRIHPILLASVEAKLKLVEKGEVYATMYEDTLKDELRPEERVKIGKTRIFCSGDLDSLIIQKMYLGTFIAEMMRDPCNSPCGLAVNAHSKEWADLYAYLKGKPEEMRRILAGDFSGFDISVKWKLINAFIAFVKDVHKGKIHGKELEAVIGSVFLGWHIFMDTVHKRPFGTPSGAYITSVFNSFVNWLLHKQAFVHLYTEDEWKEIRSTFTGDDSVVTVPQGFDDYTMDYLEWFFREEHQMTYTNCFKDATMTVTWENVTYQKRRFELGDIGMKCPLDKKSIYNMFAWSNGKPNSLWAESVIRSGQLEAFMHGREFFDEVRDWLSAEMSRLGKNWVLDTYDTMFLKRKPAY